MPAPVPQNYHFNPRKAALWGILTTIIALNAAMACLTLIPNVVLATQLAALCIAILVGGWSIYGLSVMANFMMDTMRRSADNLQNDLQPAITSINETAKLTADAAKKVAHPVKTVKQALGLEALPQKESPFPLAETTLGTDTVHIGYQHTPPKTTVHGSPVESIIDNHIPILPPVPTAPILVPPKSPVGFATQFLLGIWNRLPSFSTTQQSALPAAQPASPPLAT